MMGCTRNSRNAERKMVVANTGMSRLGRIGFFEAPVSAGQQSKIAASQKREV
jgi:hypothetical protein